MKPEALRALRVLLDEALAAPPEARDALLERVGRDDAELERELRALLRRAAEDDGRFEPLVARIEPRFPELEAGQRLGPFRLVRPLGRGGMGDVWLAERDDGTFAQRVAVKSPRGGAQGPSALQRFERERALLAGLEDPGVARIVDGGATEAGRPWLAMEYVEGRTIDRYVAEERLELRARVALVRDVARALDAAHRRLVVHRDLKPSNVLVRSDGRAALLDFGIGALLGEGGETPSASGAYLGTPRYASPEQRDGAPCSTSSDVFSLAALARELWTEGGARLDADLEAVLARASDVDPAMRLGTAAELAAELERWLDRRPVEARAASLAHRGRLFARRNPTATLAIVGAAATVVAALAYVIHAWRAERGARRRAEVAEARALTRLEDVHGLVAALVGGVHDRIGGLVGAVPVRAFVVETAERHLTALEAEAAHEPRLQRALAEVHLRLAEVRGARSYGSGGDVAAAKAHVERALERVAAAAGPGGDGALDPDLVELRLRALRLAADLARAGGALPAAEARYDEVLAGTDGALVGASPELAPRLRRTRAAALLQRGRTRFARGADVGALEDLAAARAGFEALCGAAPPATEEARSTGRDLALARAESGRVLAQLGRPEAALDAWRGAAEVLRELERAHPADGQLARDRLELEAELATTLAELGQLEAAEATVGAALAAARELARRDVGNVLASRVERLVCIRGARIAAQAGNVTLAVARYDDAERLARAEQGALAGGPGARDRQATLDLAECLVMGAELTRRTGVSEGLAVRFEEGLGLMPTAAEALAHGDHWAGNVRSVAAVGLASLAATAGEPRRAVALLEGARSEGRAWSASHGALQWPLRCEGALEYALGSAHEALAGEAREASERARHLHAAREAFAAGLAAARRLEREGRLAAHEAQVVGYFEADIARVEAALVAQ